MVWNWAWLRGLCSSGAVTEVLKSVFIISLFTVPKKSGGFSPYENESLKIPA
jgi:hypothetical protein